MKFFGTALLLGLGLSTVEATDVSFSFPDPATPYLIHGLCAMGASSVSATSSDPSVSYTPYSAPFGDRVQLWGDSDSYKTSWVRYTSQCKGGIYLQPSKKIIESVGIKDIVLTATPEAGKQVTVCAFVNPNMSDGEWGTVLPQNGFSESRIFAASINRLKSYCKVITTTDKVDAVNSPPPGPRVHDVCASGTLNDNGHHYEVVQYPLGTMVWYEAKAAAEAKTHCGKSGHLVTITSKAENDHVVGLITAKTCGTGTLSFSFIGLTDDAEEGTFEWINADPKAKEWLWFNGKEVTSDLPTGTWGRQQLGGFLVRYKESTVRAGIIREADIYLVPGGSKEKLVFKAFKSFIRIDVDWKQSENYKNAVGLLGSYSHQGERLGRDGQFIKDTNAFGLDWQVIPETDGPLFHSYEGAVVNQKCIMPASYEGSTALHGRRLGASSVDEAVAEKACNHLLDPDEKKACVFDVVATQDLSLASTW
ncbi:unknown protein [Seminavis robusta]|uniref:C-type lectin domain-containing protein n=1 Tax=Seminavis robusta TaxID=568900 RepID=A0A9N8EHB2_9STRA|nr:unknown protein [Seminavis robusta]|eukprot:Sro937_g222170.1 n/a (477) ;mRNA; f:8492-10473